MPLHLENVSSDYARHWADCASSITAPEPMGTAAGSTWSRSMCCGFRETVVSPEHLAAHPNGWHSDHSRRDGFIIDDTQSFFDRWHLGLLEELSAIHTGRLSKRR
jgi:hypothetical protein